jgi:hypothetical protein
MIIFTRLYINPSMNMVRSLLFSDQMQESCLVTFLGKNALYLRLHPRVMQNSLLVVENELKSYQRRIYAIYVNHLKSIQEKVLKDITQLNNFIFTPSVIRVHHHYSTGKAKLLKECVHFELKYRHQLRPRTRYGGSTCVWTGTGPCGISCVRFRYH